jgi:SAM-dependent methyltransferase
LTPPEISKGVMGAEYGLARRHNPAIIFRYHARALEAAEAIQRHLGTSNPVRVLDLGAADGGTMAAMAELLPEGSQFVGVEKSPELVALAKGLSANIEVFQGDIARLPRGAIQREFQVVTALAVLEHLAEPHAAVTGAAAVLHSGGLLIATCPAPRWDRIANRLQLLPDHHELLLSINRLIEIARDARLDILETRRFMWAPVGFLPYMRVPVSAKAAFFVDGAVRRTGIMNSLFVNQLLVARKP